MIPKTETTFDPEGKRNRLQDLLLAHQTVVERRNPETLKATTFLALDTGEELLKLKETLIFGDFIKCVKLMGIARSTAQGYIKVFKKFGAYREAVGSLGVSKMYVLMYLKDKDIKTLVEGGVVSGLTLADITKMSIRKVKSLFTRRNKLLHPVTWRKRVTLFIKHIKLAFSAFAGGTK